MLNAVFHVSPLRKKNGDQVAVLEELPNFVDDSGMIVQEKVLETGEVIERGNRFLKVLLNGRIYQIWMLLGKIRLS